MKQIEETPKEKSRALAVIQDDKGFDWRNFFPEEDAVGYAFMETTEPATPESTYNRERALAQRQKKKIYDAYQEAKKARSWDLDHECYLDPKGNICIDPSTIDVETLMKAIPPVEEQIKIDNAKRAEKERLKHESRERWLKSLEPKKVDEGIIDTSKEMTAENLTKMVDQVLMVKALEVDSKSDSSSESSGKVSSSGSENESGKAECAKTENVCRGCTKECKVCNTLHYFSNKRIQELIEKIKINDKEGLSREKLVKASSERIKELTENFEKDKSYVERFQKEKENEKLILENIKISEDFDKLKILVKDSDERNGKTHKENTHLSRVLQAKEKLNQQLDEIVNLKLRFQEAKIENKRINLKLNSYNFASFVLQHIVPKPIEKNKDGEDVYSDRTRVGYHNVPPPMCNNFTKKKSGLGNESEPSEKTDVEKLQESIDVTFKSQSDEDSIQYEVVKNVVKNVLKSYSDSTEEDECLLNNYISKLKSQDNLSDEPTLVTYKMSGSDKL
ncbi:hypothetical protein Hanom_Chr17g01576241 [Helianthus anomalus]